MPAKSMNGDLVGGLSTQVYALEMQLDAYKQLGDLNEAKARIDAAARLHPMVHGPEDMNWCPTCNTRWPCLTRQELFHAR